MAKGAGRLSQSRSSVEGAPKGRTARGLASPAAFSSPALRGQASSNPDTPQVAPKAKRDASHESYTYYYYYCGWGGGRGAFVPSLFRRRGAREKRGDEPR